MGFLDEFVFVMSYSVKTCMALILGVVFFFGILMLGHHYAETLHFSGLMAPLADAVRPIVEMRYEQTAWGALISFWGLAIKAYLKDRKRLFEY